MGFVSAYRNVVGTSLENNITGICELFLESQTVLKNPAATEQYLIGDFKKTETSTVDKFDN